MSVVASRFEINLWWPISVPVLLLQIYDGDTALPLACERTYKVLQEQTTTAPTAIWFNVVVLLVGVVTIRKLCLQAIATIALHHWVAWHLRVQRWMITHRRLTRFDVWCWRCFLVRFLLRVTHRRPRPAYMSILSSTRTLNPSWNEEGRTLC